MSSEITSQLKKKNFKQDDHDMSGAEVKGSPALRKDGKRMQFSEAVRLGIYKRS